MSGHKSDLWMNYERPNICSLVLSQYRSRTYWDHWHSDAHSCEHSVGHGAALIAQPDAVVIAEESSLVRWEGAFVQRRGNEHHCTVRHRHEHRSKTGAANSCNHRRYWQKDKEKHTTKTEISVTQTDLTLPTHIHWSYEFHPVPKS